MTFATALAPALDPFPDTVPLSVQREGEKVRMTMRVDDVDIQIALEPMDAQALAQALNTVVADIDIPKKIRATIVQ